MPKCKHNVLQFLHLMPKIGEGADRIRSLLKCCPFNAPEDAQYCMPHAVFHNTASGESVSDFIANYIKLFAFGGLLQPPLPDGQHVRPAWWLHQDCTDGNIPPARIKMITP